LYSAYETGHLHPYSGTVGGVGNVDSVQSGPLYGTRRNKLVSTPPTRINGIPKCAESSGSGREVLCRGPGVIGTQAGPVMLGESQHYCRYESTAKLSFSSIGEGDCFPVCFLLFKSFIYFLLMSP